MYVPFFSSATQSKGSRDPGDAGVFKIQLHLEPTAMAEEIITDRGVLYINVTWQEILKTLLSHNGLAHRILKLSLLDMCHTLLGVLTPPAIDKLMEVLCVEPQSNLTKAGDKKKLWEWVGSDWLQLCGS
jgi:hypothetical protein